MQTLGSPASVAAAISEEANAEIERLEASAATELATIRAEAAATIVIPDRDARLATTRREREERLARQEWEGRRLAMEERERWLQRVVAAGRAKWSTVSPETLDALIREAKSHLPDGPCEVVVSPSGGCIARCGDLSFDNTFDARALRLETSWRSALSGMYKP